MMPRHLIFLFLNHVLLFARLAMGGVAGFSEEQAGLVVVEAEAFSHQALDGVRRWMVTDAESEPGPYADADLPHADGASVGAYLEILPDTRTNHGEKLVRGVNFTDEPGLMGVLAYPVYFHQAGRYLVWARAFSTGSEDNGVHFGLNGTWPESGRRLQLCQGKHQWTWSSAQRRPENHCGDPRTVWLDVAEPGLHTILVSMREDGFELDKFILTLDETFEPEGMGPAVTRSTPALLEKKSAFFNIHHYRHLLMATEHFEPVEGVPGYYVDKGRAALAINAAKKANRDGFAAARFEYPWKQGATFNLVLVTLTELDGESHYRVRLNGQGIGEFQNPETETDYREVEFTMKHIQLNQGDILTVESNAVTNGKIPENDETAYSRGRWRGLVLQDPEGS
jgi:hypothetical protein